MRRLLLILSLIVVLIGVAPSAAQDDVEERNKAAVREATAQLSAGNVEGFFQLYADQFQANQGDATLYDTTVADWMPFTNALMGAIPDLQAVPVVLIAQDDRVAVELALSGTFSQPFSFAPFGPDPLPPTNQPVLWSEMHFMRFNDEGKVIEDWAISDGSYMFSQLGLMPPPDEEDNTGTRLTSPAGYQLLSEDELAATYASSRNDPSLGVFQTLIDQGLSADTVGSYTDPYVSWVNGVPYQVTAAEAQEDQEFAQALAAAMPDSKVTLLASVAEGDWTAGLVTVTGTSTNDLNLGDFGSFPATDQPVEWLLGIINRFDANGKIVEEWVETDPSQVLGPLGLMMPMDEGE